MSELIQQKKQEISDRASQIISLAQSAIQGAEEVKRRVYKSREEAIECGKLLLEEQIHVAKTLGKGSWESYFEIIFSKTISRTTAFAWIKEYKQSVAIKAGPSTSPNKPLTQATAQEHEQNTLRRGMLTLNLFPAKKHEPTSQAGPTTATPSLSPHLSLINKLVAWHTELLMQNQGALTQERRSQLIQDFTPVLAILEALRA